MKKSFMMLLLITMTAGVLAGCGKKYDDSSHNLTDINIDKYVEEVGNYKGLEISSTKQEITDEYVDSYIEYMLSQSKQSNPVTDRAVKTGDVTNIDFVGKIDGKEFDGGSAQGTDLTIGSGQFIPGFEDGMIGMKTGETKDIPMKFPDDYSNSDVAGKDVVFTVTLNSISEEIIPELNDEYVKTLGITDVTTVDQLKTYMKDTLEKNAESTYQSDLKIKVLDKLIETCKFSDEVPEGILEYYKNMYLENMTNSATQANMELADYLSQTYGMTEEQFKQESETAAKDLSQRAMLCMKIAQLEDMTVSDEELNEELEKNYATYGYESVEDLKKNADIEDYRDNILTTRVLEFLVENAKVTEEATEEATQATTEVATEAATETTETATEETTQAAGEATTQETKAE